MGIVYKTGRLPFIPMRINGSNIYTVCRSCSTKRRKETLLHCQNEDHGFKEKEIITTCYLLDFLFILKNDLCVHYEIFQLDLYSEVDHCVGLKRLAEKIYVSKAQSSSKFEKTFIKAAFLQGLGRFALNCQKSTDIQTEIYHSPDDLQITMLEGNLLRSVLLY